MMKTLTLSKEEWLEVADRIGIAGGMMQSILIRMNGDGRGQEDVNDCGADFACAIAAIHYVAEYAPDKCVFGALPGKEASS